MSGYGAQQVSLSLLKSSSIRRKYYISLSSTNSIHKDFCELLVSHKIKPFSLSTISSIFFILRLSLNGSNVVVHGHSSKSLLPFLVLSVFRPLIPRLNLVFTNHGYLRASRGLCLAQFLSFNALSLLRCLVTTVESTDPMSIISRVLFYGQKYIPNPLPFVSLDNSCLELPVPSSDAFLSSSEGRSLTLGLYGGLNNQKNPLFVIDILIKILSSVKLASVSTMQLHLSVVGDGPLFVPLEQKLLALCDSFPRFSFQLHGYSTGCQLEEILSQVDIALFPSIYDSYNISIRHAVSLGVLTVSSEAIPWPIPSIVPRRPAPNYIPIVTTRLPLDACRWYECIMCLLESDPSTLLMLRKFALEALQAEIFSSYDSLSIYNKIYARAV